MKLKIAVLLLLLLLIETTITTNFVNTANSNTLNNAQLISLFNRQSQLYSPNNMMMYQQQQQQQQQNWYNPHHYMMPPPPQQPPPVSNMYWSQPAAAVFSAPQSASSAATCGQAKPRFAIFVHRGQPTPHPTWPWHCQLTIDGNDKYDSETYCGGTLVAKNLVLTAAHCFDDLRANLRAQNTRLDFKGIATFGGSHLALSAMFVHIHPRYVPAMSEYDARLRGLEPGPIWDFALIEVIHESQETYENMMPVCLPDKDYQTAIGCKCTIMGHGFMNSDDEDNFIMPDILQMADVTISSNDECRNEIESEGIKSKVTEDTMCIQGPIHPCVGDSGGPLVCRGESPSSIQGDYYMDPANWYTTMNGAAADRSKWYLTGVTSFAVSTDSKDKCGQFKSAVFGKVSHIIDWIRRFSHY
jgi:hypothetical protein